VSGSTVPAALDALVATFTTALPGLQVTDGPDYDPRNAFLAVGWHSNDEPAVTLAQSIADAGRSRDREDYDVSCLLSWHVGNAGVSSARTELFQAFETVCSAVAADGTLGGSVHRARMSEHAYFPLIDEGGVTVSIRFTVNVVAWK
jgi:hypothetical protein